MISDRTPTYNLKAVVQETGLKPDTLRAWERRYGIPDPDRTDGGHRLYSQHDINTLKWLLARQEEGLSISRAVALWHSLRAEGRDPLVVYTLSSSREADSYTTVAPGSAMIDLRRAWIDACLAYDERRAESTLNQAFAYYAPEDVCFELLQKALAEIGDRWYEGNVSIQQEHFMSALTMRRLDALLAATPAPTRAGRLLIGCPPGENHTFSPLLLTFLLRRRGWDVLYLGADVPTDRLAMTIESTRPDLVIFSAQMLDTAASLYDVAVYLRAAGIALAYSGYIFGLVPELTHRIPGHFLGYDLRRTPAIIENLLADRPPAPPTEPVPESYSHAWAYFRERSGLIETHIWQPLNGNAALNGTAEAIRRLTNNILSALKLGDLDYIAPNLQWLVGMMSSLNLPADTLCHFLTAYHAATAQHLDATLGQPVIAWLAKVVAECRAQSSQEAKGQASVPSEEAR
ncbi:MAG TPA: MerR family transcriptional regulator [Promineifilum sp.]|nr:MerR family transcriptional regulator [Promineifilum sp.]